MSEDRLVSFSLILGTVERTRDLEFHLASLDAQTYRNFGLIIVDQNKDERLAPILAPYKDRFPILHLRSEPGLTRAKNLGLKHVTGDIVGFPDDNCQFPPDLLGEVARFFVDHPQVEGLTGRSVDENGVDSNGKFDTEAGAVDKFNVWRRSTAYTIFLRRDTVKGVWYDEKMGPGAGTVWGAGDDHDYLLQVMERGSSLVYDPDLLVIHPQPITQFDEKAAHRAYTYTCGAGRAIRKHDFSWWFKAWWLLKPVSGLVLRLVGLKGPPGVSYRWGVCKGRLRGLRGERGNPLV
ncbi:MAG: glycosyltransferase [Rubrobacteraceae bacterium]